MGFQTYTVLGNLTEDPVMKYVGQNAVTTFSIACNQRFGQTEEVLFVDCEAWGKTAEFAAEWYRKGSPVIARGRWKRDSWDDKTSGQKRYKYFVKVDETTFAGSRPEGDEERPARRNEERPKRKYDDNDLPF